MEIEVNVNGEAVMLTEDNVWVCIFTAAPIYNHIFWMDDEGSGHAFFEVQDLIDIMLRMGFPFQQRRYPTDQDEAIFAEYLAHQTDHLEEELDGLNGQDGDSQGD